MGSAVARVQVFLDGVRPQISLIGADFKTHLKMHEGMEGDLLGAFSYSLKKEDVSPKAVESGAVERT